MKAKKKIYLYPITPYTLKEGSNDYILKLKAILDKENTVINKETTKGVFDILFKLPKFDIVYFNWIADLPDKKLGFLQIPALFLVLVSSKLLGKKIVWFIHNNISHSNKNLRAKRFIQMLMMIFSDKVLSHSKELNIAQKVPSLKYFDHPVEENFIITNEVQADIDILIWGKVNSYKGVDDFIKYASKNKSLQQLKITVAGKFSSQKLYQEIMNLKSENITIVNKVLQEDELIHFFERSRYVLFCYNSTSVLSSGALSTTLSYGKTILGPLIGSFKELGEKGLIYNYSSFHDLTHTILKLKEKNEFINKSLIEDYISSTTWQQFSIFLQDVLNENKEKPEKLRAESKTTFKGMLQ